MAFIQDTILLFLLSRRKLSLEFGATKPQFFFQWFFQCGRRMTSGTYNILGFVFQHLTSCWSGLCPTSTMQSSLGLSTKHICIYKHNVSPILSIVLARFIRYRKFPNFVQERWTTWFDWMDQTEYKWFCKHCLTFKSSLWFG